MTMPMLYVFDDRGYHIVPPGRGPFEMVEIPPEHEKEFAYVAEQWDKAEAIDTWPEWWNDAPHLFLDGSMRGGLDLHNMEQPHSVAYERARGELVRLAGQLYPLDEEHVITDHVFTPVTDGSDSPDLCAECNGGSEEHVSERSELARAVIAFRLLGGVA